MTEVDHVVVAAATLEQGVAWGEATFGIAPGPGGKHALFATHNRLLKIASATFPRCYLEIIAVDPDPAAAAARLPQPRWFGLDDAPLRERLAREGPCLLHVVARTPALEARLQALAALGVDAGVPLAASRPGAQGLLRWRIAVRRDGALLCGGALPTLIEWDGPHPSDAMADSPVRLQSLALAGVPADAAAVLALGGTTFVAQSARAAGAPGDAALSAEFDTPRGRITLASPHIIASPHFAASDITPSRTSPASPQG
jgi:hypothetical protein